jgi:hypothetical protein
MRFVLALFLLILTSGAQAETAHFKVRLGAISVGMLQLDHQNGANSYVTRSRFATKGLAGALKPVHFDIQAEGRVGKQRLFPSRYVEDMNTGRRRSNADIRFAEGDKQIDPATAILIGLRDRPVEEGCATRHRVFDGERTNRLVITESAWEGDLLTCKGRFARLAGYSQAELEKHRASVFTLSYQRVGGRLIAHSGRATTRLGAVIIKRQ